MYEAILTYSGYARAEGRCKVTLGKAYRCKVCGYIDTDWIRCKKHTCVKPQPLHNNEITDNQLVKKL